MQPYPAAARGAPLARGRRVAVFGVRPVATERAAPVRRVVVEGVVGDVIEQAHEAQSDLASQRETLEGSTNTAQSLTDRLPSIDSIIQKMRQKKYRENAVVGVTVGCCASFLLWAVLT